MRHTMIAAVAAMSLWAGGAAASELSFANYMAPTNPYEDGAFKPFVEMVSERTGGAVTVQLYSGGALGAGPAEQYNRAVGGVADLVVGLPGYTASSFPLTLLSELPGVLEEETATQTLLDNLELLETEYSRVQLISLWTNAQNLLYMRDTAVRTPADIAGKNIRVPSRNAGLIVESWGGSPVSMPVSEVYNALQTGVIDGALIDGTATHAFKLIEVAAHLTAGMDTTISPFFILMNRNSFAGLSPEHQAAVKEVGREVSLLANETQLKAANAGIEAFAAAQGKQLIRLSADEAKAFNDLSASVRDKVVDEEAAKGVPARELVDALSSN